MRLGIILSTLIILSSNLSFSQTIHDLNTRLGRGVNYGNMLEAPTEQEWGNPWQSEYPEIIADLGFNHVRIPIRWEPEERSSAVAPYTISAEWLARVKEVVDATLAEDLLAVINMHHHHELFEDAAGNKARFLAQWEQISDFFKDYPDDLLFEILNEPNGAITAEVWNEYLRDALDLIRVENPTRAVLIGTPDWGGLGGLPDLSLPDDDNIILTIHYYNPFQFTHQGAEWLREEDQEENPADAWLGTEWQDTDLEREVIENEFSLARSMAQDGVAIHIGEFGAYNPADDESREKWTTFLARYFEEQGWSWAYWEFSAGFGFYNPNDETYVDYLVDALLNNEMPEPATYSRTSLYQSDFTSGEDDWNLSANNGASAQLSVDNNALNVSISQLGSENWHIQLVRNNFSLEAGKKYSISFEGSATANRSVGFYTGKASADWDQYGATTVTLGQESSTYSAVFDMQTTDASARLVFDLGSSLEDVTISDIKVEELELQEPGEPTDPDPPLNLEERVHSSIYPNPNFGMLNINNLDQFTQLTLYNIHGQKVVSVPISDGVNAVNTSNWPKGMSFIELSDINNKQVFRVWTQ